MERKNLIEVAFKVLMFSGLVLAIGLHFTKGNSIVYVDAAKLMENYKGMQSARQQLEFQVSTWRSNLDTLGNELQVQVVSYEQEKSRYTSREKLMKEELIKAKREQYLNYENAVNEKIQSADRELTNRVLGEVNAYLKKYGEQKGYDIILAATQYGNIVYAKEGKDITDEVLVGLNK